MGIVFGGIPFFLLYFFPTSSGFTIDKANHLFIVQHQKFYYKCCKNCVKTQSFDINQIYQAELSVNESYSHKKSSRTYKLGLRLLDGSLVEIGDFRSSSKSSWETKRDAINQMLFNFRGNIPNLNVAKNSYSSNQTNMGVPEFGAAPTQM